MANQEHLNVDAGAQGGDNEDQTTQMGGGAPSGMSQGPLRTGGVGSATAGLLPSDGGSGNASGILVGDNNTGAVFSGSSVGSGTAQDRDQGAGDADTKSDQSDYSTGRANDDLLASTDSSGMTGGTTGGGSVANAAVSMGDVLRGAGAGTGSATGSRDNSGGAMSNDYSGTTSGDTDGTSVTPQGGSGDVPAAPNPDAMP